MVNIAEIKNLAQRLDELDAASSHMDDSYTPDDIEESPIIQETISVTENLM
ncbi:hypothetical protein HYW84_03565 [Candidatus Peregrinibacteria bacterium]|nr:hypothetical protein [Candidatus Peregrinibacteria bacterium]